MNTHGYRSGGLPRRWIACAVQAMLRGATVLLCTASMAGTPQGFSRAVLDSIPVAPQAVLADHYPQARVSFAGGVIGLPDLTYEALPGYRPLHLDLYLPPGEGRSRPLVVYIHGGGWQSGHTRHSGAFENWPAVLALIASRGYVVASVEYRLSREAPFPAAIQDVKAAIRWLRAHAAQYGIDPGRAIAWGGSAGGHLAALAAVTCGVAALEPPAPGVPAHERGGSRESDCVQGLVSWYGVFDFSMIASSSGREEQGRRPLAPGSAVARFLGCPREGCTPRQLEAASPVTYVQPGDPPALLIHGTADHTVPVQQSHEFLSRLRSKGVQAEFVEIPGVGHSFVGPDQASTRAASLRALDRSFEFIEQTVGSRQVAKANSR